MEPVIKRPRASTDIAEIWEFIADDSVAEADKFLAVLEVRLLLLSEQPRMGRQRKELGPELRSLPYGRYVLFYLPHADGIELVRIIHSSRDISRGDMG